MTSLAGKTAFITGAKGGLGAFVTRAFLDAGAHVYGTSRSIRAEDFNHPGFTALPGQLTNAETTQALAARLPSIDIAVHLLGGFAGGRRVDETSAEELDKMLDLNLRSAFFLAGAVLPRMRDQGSGRFLAVGSRSAVEPSAMSGAYGLSKAALVSLIRTIAAENADRSITANLVLPGTMDTPANRAAMPAADPSTWVNPAHVAALLVYLASDLASNISGASIPIYGGGPE